jgi:hypothetical protein
MELAQLPGSLLSIKALTEFWHRENRIAEHDPTWIGAIPA